MKVLIGRALILCFSLGAYAQPTVDPSSALLLKSGGRPPAKENLDSSRYTVRPSGPKPEKTTSEVRQVEKVPKVQEKKTTTIETQTVEPAVNPPTVEMGNKDGESKNYGVPEQMREVLLGGSAEEIDEYRKRLHPHDVRQNLVEVLFAPTFIYNASKSSYWYREYVSGAPGLHIATNFWLTPFFGIQGSYLGSLGADIRGNVEGTKHTAVDHQWFTAGLRFRNFFGLSRKASALVVGLDYEEYSLKVPGSDQDRIGVKSTGVKISFEALMPSSTNPQFAWILSTEILPRLNHKELSSDITVQSGGKDKSNAVGVGVGGQYTFNRNNQIFYKLSYRLEKNLFDGAADTVDPKTGMTPEGVSVNNSTSIFEIGYRWGN